MRHKRIAVGVLFRAARQALTDETRPQRRTRLRFALALCELRQHGLSTGRRQASDARQIPRAAALRERVGRKCHADTIDSRSAICFMASHASAMCVVTYLRKAGLLAFHAAFSSSVPLSAVASSATIHASKPSGGFGGASFCDG